LREPIGAKADGEESHEDAIFHSCGVFPNSPGGDGSKVDPSSKRQPWLCFDQCFPDHSEMDLFSYYDPPFCAWP
jgi:hypothetical protein